MKAISAVLLVLLLGVARGSAQTQALESSQPQSPSAARPIQAPQLLQSMRSQDLQLGDASPGGDKRLRIGGPLIQPFKGKRLWEAPGRFVRLINPFAKTERRSEVENASDISPRAWSSVVGWSNGRSAFPDAVSHEPSMGLFSVSR